VIRVGRMDSARPVLGKVKRISKPPSLVDIYPTSRIK
jgi:hypothetical protein